MALAGRPKRKLPGIGCKKSKIVLLPGTSLASVESLSMPLVQEVVLSADIGCAACQKRVADILTRMRAETDSVSVNLLEKKVTITCRYSSVVKIPGWQIAYRSPLGRMDIIKRILWSSCS